MLIVLLLLLFVMVVCRGAIIEIIITKTLGGEGECFLRGARIRLLWKGLLW
jgi:hypothetical protein